MTKEDQEAKLLEGHHIAVNVMQQTPKRQQDLQLRHIQQTRTEVWKFVKNL